MAYTKLILSIIILLGIGYLYERWKREDKKDRDLIDYDLVRKYLLDENSLGEVKKPILWIHISYDINARKWENFGSRNTYNLNQPYLYLTIKSIINKCGDDFHICLIDDRSIKKLLPTWSIDLRSTANPIKEHLRKLALSKILYNYGGILVPASFVCLHSFKNYYDTLDENNMLVGEFINRNGNLDTDAPFYPNTRLMACRKESQAMLEFSNHLEYLNSTNYSGSYDFDNLENSWCMDQVSKNMVSLIKARHLGVRDEDNNIINIDRLMGDRYIQLCNSAIGLYIPSEELLKRTAYNWFAYLNMEKVLTSNTLVGKYLLISQD